MDFDATSLYPSAMWDKSSVYPEKETGLTFKPHKIDSCKEAFNIRTSNQNINESAILRKKMLQSSCSHLSTSTSKRKI